MALILCIETATEVCSVALARDEKILGIKESSARNVHSAMLTLFIDDLIKSSGFQITDLDAIAVSMGPGSYTGLRIGVAAAKGLCYAIDKPLIAVHTLQAMAVGMNDQLQMTDDQLPMTNDQLPMTNGQSGIFLCPMIDARRMEVYSAVFDQQNREIREVCAEIIDDFSFQELLTDHRIAFGGEGAEKCKPVLGDHPNALFMDGFQASARFITRLAEEKFREKKFESLAYFEPFYLKDFVAGKPRVKGLI
jgi:tRNA threonylcarbamoyladenosine biosynthesis protein TsaB